MTDGNIYVMLGVRCRIAVDSAATFPSVSVYLCVQQALFCCLLPVLVLRHVV